MSDSAQFDRERQHGGGFVPPERLPICRWPDPLVEHRGFPVTSIYTETVWLPILGPASVLCLRRLGGWAAANPAGIEVDTRSLARDLGLGDKLYRNAAISRTLNRLCQFDMACWTGDRLAVRTAVAPPPERQLRRLSPELLAVHRHLLGSRDTHQPAPASAPEASPAVVAEL